MEGTVIKKTVMKTSNGLINSECWKITTSTHSSLFDSGPCERKSYSVIRCSKTGKEFKEKNGFLASFIDDLIVKKKIIYTSVFNITTWEIIGQNKDGLKAKASGIEIDIKKRRVSYLESTIANHKKELEKLKKELSEFGEML